MKRLAAMALLLAVAGCDRNVKSDSPAEPKGSPLASSDEPTTKSKKSAPTQEDIEKAAGLQAVYLLKEEKLKKLVEDLKKGPYTVPADQVKTRDERHQHNAEVIAKVMAILKTCDETKLALSRLEAAAGPRLDGQTTVEYLGKVKAICQGAIDQFDEAEKEHFKPELEEFRKRIRGDD